jgi:hypothetical protein
MMRVTGRMKLLALLATVALIALAESVGGEAEYPLGIRSARIRFRSRGDTEKPVDSLILKAVFEDWQVPSRYDPAADGLRVTVAGRTVLSVPPVDDRARLVAKPDGRYRYVERPSAERVGVRKCVVDVVKGRIKLKARRLNLTDIWFQEPTDVPITLTFGDVSLTGRPDFRDEGSRWTIRALSNMGGAQFPEVWPGGWGNDPGSGYLHWRPLLAEARTELTTSAHLVLRDEASYVEFWNARIAPSFVGEPPPERPDVDFGEEMVVGIFIGQRPTWDYGVEVNTVTAQGDGALVRYVELAPDIAPPLGPFFPYLLIAIARVPGPVEFRSNRQLISPK